jgi:hypothetical protein
MTGSRVKRNYAWFALALSLLLPLFAYPRRASAHNLKAHQEKLARADEDARAWVRGLLLSSIDLRPDPESKTLTVRLHRHATSAQDVALDHVCAELNATETIYPRTELRLVFQPVGSTQIPKGQEF